MTAWLCLLFAAEHLTPAESLKAMKLPKGFKATLVASEPDLIKPIHMTTDAKGRLWVVESHSYPHWLKEDAKAGKDRVLVYERVGEKWKQAVFLKDGVNLSGIAVGHGGVWLCSVPRVVFIPTDFVKLKPTGEPVVKLDGFSLKTKHNVVSNLAWGPDGWLYGLNGIQSESEIGAPGSKARVKMNCGVWRYHPTRKTVEAVAHGTTNPWGLDWDEHGELFITNCVIKHLFHVVPGARFVRMYGQDVNPHTYGLIESCADHIHWAGGDWTDSRGGKPEHSDAGGGHAHAGAMFYLGTTFPKEYRNRLFMANIHGNRLNTNVIERKGSGYVGKRSPDFLMANDPWFRGVTQIMAPDGGMFVSDWHDTGECHNYDKTHPSGRIWHIQHGDAKWSAPDVSSMSDEELVKRVTDENEWVSRQARLALQEGRKVRFGSPANVQLHKMLKEAKDERQRLRCMWALHELENFDEMKLLADPSEHVRAWAVRLFANRRFHPGLKTQLLATHAAREKSPFVRLALASAMQKLRPSFNYWDLAINLSKRAEDAADPYVPLMVWYGIEGKVPDDPGIALTVARSAKLPAVRRFIARRIAGLENGLAYLPRALADASNDARRDMLAGMSEALAGRGKLAAPTGWADARSKLADSKDTEVRQRTMRLAAQFGDAEAIASLKTTVKDPKAADRAFALEVLLDNGDPDGLALARKLLDDAAMRGAALRALARFDAKETSAAILALYPKLTPDEKEDALGTLASRPAYALALLEAIESKTVPRGDVSAYWARQMLALKDKTVSAKLATAWGTLRPPAKERDALTAKYKKLAEGEHRRNADLARGRMVFDNACGKCHRMFGEGGKIGPELTGSQREKAEYVLHKVLDPNATVPRDWQASIIRTKRGRVITGVVKEESERLIVVQTPTEEVRVRKSDIEKREQTRNSLMPEGQLQAMKDEEVRDLLAYLASKAQAARKP
ncbi:MAG: c-type cytochrome [Gemmataceae bacterium]|nr:c-type cytochrome [Gemmataceae bacterium]